MKKLIELDAALDALRDVIVPAKDVGYGDESTDGYNDGVDMAVTVVSGLPTVDAVPVVHGRWKTVEDWDGDEHYQCSVCGAEFVLIDGDPDDNDYLYCPHCGAKMDGKDGDHETD